MSEEKIPPIHPGEVLLEEFLRPMGLSQNQVAHHGRHRVTAGAVFWISRSILAGSANGL